MTAKRTITSVELPEKMLYDLSRLADQMRLSKSDLIRWGIERILSNPPEILSPIDGQITMTEVEKHGTKEVRRTARRNHAD